MNLKYLKAVSEEDNIYFTVHRWHAGWTKTRPHMHPVVNSIQTISRKIV